MPRLAGLARSAPTPNLDRFLHRTESSMQDSLAYALAIMATFVVNMPFGYWRAGVRKY